MNTNANYVSTQAKLIKFFVAVLLMQLPSLYRVILNSVENVLWHVYTFYSIEKCSNFFLSCIHRSSILMKSVFSYHYSLFGK